MTALAQPNAASSTEEVDQRIAAVTALIDEMIEVVGSENEVLARGLPASLASSIARKNELADLFSQHIADVKSFRLPLIRASAARRQEMIERSRVLQQEIDENCERLRAAISASRTRVDAIMQVIREQAANDAGYGADGRGRADASSALGVRLDV